MPIRNPSAYGARAGREATKYVQKALDAAQPGDVVAGGKFVYDVRDLVLRRKENVTIRGLRLNDVGSSFATIHLEACNNCVIEGNDINAPGGWAAVMSWSGNRNAYRANIIHDGRTTGNSAARGLWLGNPGAPETRARVEGNEIFRMNASAIAMMGLDHLIVNNVIHQITDGAGIALAADIDGNARLTAGGRSIVARNVLHDIINIGIQSDATGGARVSDVAVQFNTLSRIGKAAIYPVHADNWSIMANDISGCAHGIVADFARNVTMTGNAIAGAKLDGVLAGTQTEIAGMSILANVLSGVGRFAVHVSPYNKGVIRRLLIAGNSIDGCDRGLMIAPGEAGTFADVIVCDNPVAAAASADVLDF